MKLRWLVCGGLADEPTEDLGGRTPLDVAKTPHLDRLAKEGKMGAAIFTPHSLTPGPDVACYSILGFNPTEFYTGPGPLEAAALGIDQNDRSVAFRCNFVTVLDESLVDACAGNISDKESLLLVGDLNKKISNPKIKLFANHGYKNILIVDDGDRVEPLSQWESAAPRDLVGQKIDKILLKNSAGGLVASVMQQSHALLDGHEINRVRVDLKENPANMVWLWGQGKRPKLPSFAQRAGRDGTAVCNADFAKGLTRCLGMRQAPDLDSALDDDFVFVYQGLENALDRHVSLKERIKWIEEFDALFISKIVKETEKDSEVRICVSGDSAVSSAQKKMMHGRVPFLMVGKGIEADEAVAFNEKTAAQSTWIVDKGETLMGSFLK